MKFQDNPLQLSEIRGPKFANVYKQMWARGSACQKLPQQQQKSIHFFVDLLKKWAKIMIQAPQLYTFKPTVKTSNLHVWLLCYGVALQSWQLRVAGSEEAADKDECITEGLQSGLVPSGLLAVKTEQKEETWWKHYSNGKYVPHWT